MPDDPQQRLSTQIDRAILDDEKRLVTAWVAITHDKDGNEIVDGDGDLVDLDSLEAAFVDAMRHGGAGMSDVQHEEFGVNDIVQFFVLSNAEREALGFGPGKAGAIAKFYIGDDATWQRVKSGDLREASVVASVEQVEPANA